MMNPVISFVLMVLAHAVVSFLGFYSSDVGESPKEQELRGTLKEPSLRDMEEKFSNGQADFWDLHRYTQDVILPADRYFELREDLVKLRKDTYVFLAALAPSVFLFWKARMLLLYTGMVGGKGVCTLATLAVFVALYFAVRFVYKRTLKLPEFTSNSTKEEWVISDHYSYLRAIEKSLRRRNNVKFFFILVFFLFFWNPAGYYE